MKICLVNSFYTPWRGGAERYVMSLAKQLTKKGHEITVLCSEKPLRSGQTMEDGVAVQRLRTPLMMYGTPIVVFPTDFFSQTYDVIHANFPGPFLAALSAYAGILSDTPSVLTWHNDLPSVTSAAGLLVRLHDATSSLYLDQYRRIVATTNVYARKSKTLRRYSYKTDVIQNGVDSRMFNPSLDGSAIRAKYGMSGSKVILFVGALTPWHGYKGLDVLIAALPCVMSKVRGARLLVVGDGQMRGAYEKFAARCGVPDAVTFAGRVDDSILPYYYVASDLLVLPSKNESEGFGLVLLEAMASARAVVASAVGGVVEVVTSGENGILVEPNDVDALAESIEYLLENDDLRAEIGRRGRKFAESRDWSVVADSLLAVYEKIRL